jgi:hypothetical protein
MTPQQQGWTLLVLLLCVIGLRSALYEWPPTIAGEALRRAELSTPLAQLRPAEFPHLFLWLRLAVLAALLYAIFFTWGLRWLSRRLRRGAINTLGRALSWITALAILFNLAEIAILWTAATIGARRISPWLTVLVKLEWLPLLIFIVYVILWLAARRFNLRNLFDDGMVA